MSFIELFLHRRISNLFRWQTSLNTDVSLLLSTTSICILRSFSNPFKLSILFSLRSSLDKDFNFLRAGGTFVNLFVFKFSSTKCSNLFIDSGKLPSDSWLLLRSSFSSNTNRSIKFSGIAFNRKPGTINLLIVSAIFCKFSIVSFPRSRRRTDTVFSADLVGRR